MGYGSVKQEMEQPLAKTVSGKLRTSFPILIIPIFIIFLDATPKSVILIRPFHPIRGAGRDRHERGMECDGRGCVAWRAARMRTAKACRPSALVAGAKPVGANSAGDGDTKAGLTGARTR